MKKILCIGGVTTDIILSPVDSLPPPGVLRAVQSAVSSYGLISWQELCGGGQAPQPV